MRMHKYQEYNPLACFIELFIVLFLFAMLACSMVGALRSLGSDGLFMIAYTSVFVLKVSLVPVFEFLPHDTSTVMGSNVERCVCLCTIKNSICFG